MEANIKDIAEMLEMRKDVNNRTALFLGARVGAFFGNSKLYDALTTSSILALDKLTNTEKFAECYRVLNDKDHKTLSDVYAILSASLKNESGLGYRQEDDCLVELVKDGYFDVIISTNIDVLLEDAFTREEMAEPLDYRVYIQGLHTDIPIVRRETKYCTIVKVFGDLVSRQYATALNEFNLEKDEALKEFLESTLARDILVVGYDPEWDGPIERAFPGKGGDIWYVNEEEPTEKSLITRTKRISRHIHGREGSYSIFMKALHSRIMHRNPLRFDTVRSISTRLQNIDSGVTGLQNEVAILRADVQKLLAFKAQGVQLDQPQGEL
jgi:hypothetical protein